jgi:hypothetical protein
MELDPDKSVADQLRQIDKPTYINISEYELCMAKCFILKPKGTNGKYGWCDSWCRDCSFTRMVMEVDPIEENK